MVVAREDGAMLSEELSLLDEGEEDTSVVPFVEEAGAAGDSKSLEAAGTVCRDGTSGRPRSVTVAVLPVLAYSVCSSEAACEARSPTPVSNSVLTNSRLSTGIGLS